MMDLGFFDYQPRTRLIYGNGALNQLGGLTCELGGSRVLIDRKSVV